MVVVPWLSLVLAAVAGVLVALGLLGGIAVLWVDVGAAVALTVWGVLAFVCIGLLAVLEGVLYGSVRRH